MNADDHKPILRLPTPDVSAEDLERLRTHFAAGQERAAYGNDERYRRAHIVSGGRVQLNVRIPVELKVRLVDHAVATQIQVSHLVVAALRTLLARTGE
jgi:hypothetical protein